MDNIDYIKKQLELLGSDASPSEMQGSLCGVICGRGELDAQEWLSMIINDIPAGDLLAQEACHALAQFFKDTEAALADSHLGFYPLIPEHDSDCVKLEAIAQWAQGFLMGLSLAGIKNFDDYSDEVNEFVETMVTLSSAEDYELSGDETDEESLMELIEFIRIGVLLVNEEMNPIRVPIEIPTDDKLH